MPVVKKKRTSTLPCAFPVRPIIPCITRTASLPSALASSRPERRPDRDRNRDA
jgi:hypothetical protein